MILIGLKTLLNCWDDGNGLDLKRISITARFLRKETALFALIFYSIKENA